MASYFVTLDIDGSPTQTWVAVPNGNGRYPGVVVAQHAGGLDTFVRDICDRLAEAGFAAAAPDMYHRQEGMTFEELAAVPHDDPDRFKKMMAKAMQLKDEEIEADVRASFNHLRKLPEVASEPIGIIGFCGGGRVVYVMSARISELAAAAMFHPGGVPVARDGRVTAIDLTAEIGCPIAGFFGLDDENPSPAHVAEMDAAMNAAGIPHEFHSYPATGHSFLDYTNPKAYRAGPAKEAWDGLMKFLGETLKRAVPA